MRVPYTLTADIALYFETMGDPSGRPIVLVEGTGAQLTATPEEFCGLLVDRGFFVIRFDNRDTGLSQRFGGPDDLDGGYRLADMGQDIGLVLDALGLTSAHVAGWSMGGMMAQMLALETPERVRSLALFFTIPGKEDPRYFPDGTGRNPALEVVPPRLSRDAYRVASIEMSRRHIAAEEFDEGEAGRFADAAYDRGYAPDGVVRQWTALRRAPERLERLRTVTVPTLVVHGRDDLALNWAASVEIAQAIPEAELQIHPDMGHRMPRALWPTFVDAIVRTAARAEDSDHGVRDRPSADERIDS